METIEIKSVSTGSVFRFFGGILMLMGLVIGLLVGLVGEPALPGAFKEIPFLGTTGPGILSGIILGILYGLMGGLCCAILATIYNIFAGLLGGIRVVLEE